MNSDKSTSWIIYRNAKNLSDELRIGTLQLNILLFY